MDPPPPPPPHAAMSYSSSILAISIVGIVATAILLLAYSLFLTKCCLHFPRRPSHLLLLRLSSSHSPTTTTTTNTGLSLSSIRSLPTLRFSQSKSKSPLLLDCAVCLADFRDHDLLRLLPTCSHSFHIDCIDTWLQSHPNCPLCRSLITTSNYPFPLLPLLTSPPLPSLPPPPPHVVIEVRDNQRSTSSTPRRDRRGRRKVWEVASVGDEGIDMVRDKDEAFEVKPMRRSFSMDSSGDRQLYLSVQEILMQNPGLFRDRNGIGEGSSSGCGNGRIRRSFFSFGHGRSSRSAVLPLRDEPL